MTRHGSRGITSLAYGKTETTSIGIGSRTTRSATK